MAEVTAEQEKCVVRIKRCSETAYYDILSVDQSNCSEVKVKKAYHKLSLLLHPDKNKHPDASEAFKKMKKAWTVLSDEKLKKIYDQTGRDPESRFNPVDRTPFQDGFANRRAGPGGFPADFGGVDITPEELFRQFFGGGGGAGAGFGGPFEQTFFFGGPGVFQAQRFPRQQRQQAGAQQQPQQQQASPLTYTSLLIFLLPFIFSIVSYLFSTAVPSGPGFRFDAAVPPYTAGRVSSRLQVPYWVNPAETAELAGKSLADFDRRVEVSYVGRLDGNCQVERNQRDRLIQDAHGLFFTNQDKLKKARAHPMPSCLELANLRSR